MVTIKRDQVFSTKSLTIHTLYFLLDVPFKIIQSISIIYHYKHIVEMDNMANGPSCVEILKFANHQGICAFPDEVTLWTMWSIRSETELVAEILLATCDQWFLLKGPKDVKIAILGMDKRSTTIELWLVGTKGPCFGKPKHVKTPLPVKNSRIRSNGGRFGRRQWNSTTRALNPWCSAFFRRRIWKSIHDLMSRYSVKHSAEII